MREARGYAFQRGRNGSLVENPIRTERTSSIRVRTDAPSHWKDFGSDGGGDLIDFLEGAEGMTKAAAQVAAAEILGVSSSAGFGASLKTHTAKLSTPTPPTALDLEAVIQQAHEPLLHGTTPEAVAARANLQRRGLDPAGATVRYARLGVVDGSVELDEQAMKRYTFQGRVLFPYLDDRDRPVSTSSRCSGPERQCSRAAGEASAGRTSSRSPGSSTKPSFAST
nr:hypothetical protein [Trueperaceae bacterium]